MRLREIKSIDVYTRWWHDAEYGNPYYARKIVVNQGLENEQVFTIKMTWGSVDGIENDHVERILKLPNSVSFTNHSIFRKIRCRSCYVRTIRYNYHNSIRVYRESALSNPKRFRNQ